MGRFANQFESAMRGFDWGRKIAGELGSAYEINKANAAEDESLSKNFTAAQGTELNALADAGTHDITHENGKYIATAKPEAVGGGTQAASSDVAADAEQPAAPVQDAQPSRTFEPTKSRDLTTDERVSRLQRESDINTRFGLVDRARDSEWRARSLGEANQRAELNKRVIAEHDVKLTQQEEINAALADAPVPAANAETPQGDAAYQTYRKFMVPKAVKAYIKAGRMAEAKAFLEFTRDQEGEHYARQWLGAVQSVNAGDFEAAIPALGQLYNRAVPDGRRAEWESIGDGRYRVSQFDEATGAKISEQDFDAPDLAKMAINTLSPAARVETVLATQKEQRKLKQQEAQEDRRDDRLQTRLDAQSENLDRRLAARGGLTPTQERSNIEIDAARERIASMDPAEIRRRSNKATNTGRENPDYDPSIARAAALAARRKVGDDPDFDSRQGQQPAAPKAEPVQSRFSSDPAMKGRKMGKLTPDGYEVLDASGKLLGHYH